MQDSMGILSQWSTQDHQGEEARRHNDLLEKLILLETVPRQLRYLDDLAREIADANQEDGAAEKQAILNLIGYLEELDYYHGTEAKQKLIQHLRNDPAFVRFRQELGEFERMIARLRVPFLVDRTIQLDRLDTLLRRFDDYELTID